MRRIEEDKRRENELLAARKEYYQERVQAAERMNSEYREVNVRTAAGSRPRTTASPKKYVDDDDGDDIQGVILM